MQAKYSKKLNKREKDIYDTPYYKCVVCKCDINDKNKGAYGSYYRKNYIGWPNGEDHIHRYICKACLIERNKK